MDKDREAPDWPPLRSAVYLPDGQQAYGSTGQLFVVKGGQWVRAQVEKPALVRESGADG